jgi:ParB family chromosome partitioning protein
MNLKILSIEVLTPFKNASFKVYEDKRFSDMVESIKIHGILTPIIVRPSPDVEGSYEILSGNSRAACGKAAGLTEIPAIVMEDIDDDRAAIIAGESNVMQRSVNDLPLSQRADVLSSYYKTLKKQGKKTDLEKRVKDYTLNFSEYPERTYGRTGRKLNWREDLAGAYNMSARSVGRYLRVNELSPDFKEMLDNEKIDVPAAVEISYLNPEQQAVVLEILAAEKVTLSAKKAERLRKLKKNRKKTFDYENAKNILTGVKRKRKIVKEKQVLGQGLGDINEITKREFPEYFDTDKELNEKEKKIKILLHFYYIIKDKLCKYVPKRYNPNTEDAEILSRVIGATMTYYSNLRFS